MKETYERSWRTPYGEQLPFRDGTKQPDLEKSDPTGVAFLRKELWVWLGIKLTDGELRELDSLYRSLGMDRCRFAIQTATAQKKPYWAYVRGILRNLEFQKTREERKLVARRQGGSRGYNESRGQGFEAYCGGRVPRSGGQIFQTHGKTTVTPLERQAIESALRETYGENWKEICNESKEE